MTSLQKKREVKAWASEFEFVTGKVVMRLYRTKQKATEPHLGLNRDGRPEIIPVTITYTYSLPIATRSLKKKGTRVRRELMKHFN